MHAGETLLSDPETHCLLLSPTARLCQHYRDGHPQVPEREEPTQGKKGEERRRWQVSFPNLIIISTLVFSRAVKQLFFS